jgi:capsular polysaccharide biosynthesis protein
MEHGSQLKTVSGALRHRLPIALAVVGLCLLAGVLVVILLPRTYKAESLLLVDAQWEGASDPASALSASDTLTRLYIAEATSGPLLQQVVDQNKLGVSSDRLAKQVTASTVHATTLVAIDATSRSPQQAARIANAVAQTLMDRNRTDVLARFDPQRTYLESELARLDAAIKSVQSEKLGTSAAAASDHAARLSLLQGQYSGIYTQLQNILLAQSHGISTLTVNALAGPPTGPVSPDPVRYLLAALAIGLALGVLAALLAERFDDRLYTAESLAEATGSPLVLAAASRGVASNGTATVASRNAYALTLASVRAKYPDEKMLMVVAAAPRDRADGVATGIGKAAAYGGERVVLVRADPVDGIPHSVSPNGSGLTIVRLPSTPDPRLALGRLADGNGPYDFTVLSVPSPQSDPVAMSLAGAARLAILVATAKQTRFGEARDAAEALRQAGFAVAGSVLIAKEVSGSHGGPTAKS